jgi:DNA primase
MPERISFQRLRRKVWITEVARDLNLNLTRCGKQYRGPCPICKHKSQRCFVITPSKNLYYCFGDCKEGGDALQLVARIKQLNLPETAALMAEWYGIRSG